jgi:hypothetical protein
VCLLLWIAAMGKYEPLGKFLRQQGSELVVLKFEDIERIVGSKLPQSSRQHRAWWSNNPNNNVMTKVWLDAGFQTEQVDIEGRRLVFRKMSPGKQDGPSASPNVPAGEAPPQHHPLLGALKGLLRIMPGTDLTKPADPGWGAK